MRQFAAPVKADTPHQEPPAPSSAEPPLTDKTDTQTGLDVTADIPESISDELSQQEEAILADEPSLEPSLEPSRATPSGRLYSQLPRTDAQTALRMMSFITQGTYVYVRARRRDSIAQKPFPNELRAIRLLYEYVTFVRPRLSRLNQALNRLGITLSDPRHDPRWILASFLDPFSDADVEHLP
jgi:hypothetical protein